MRRVLLVTFVCVGCMAVVAGAACADTVAFWNFNNSLTDSSINGHDGFATDSGIGVQYATAPSTIALHSAAGTSDVTIPGSSQFQFSGTSGFTVEARVKLDPGWYSTIIDCTGPSGGSGWWLRATNAGALQSDVYDGSGEREVSGTTNIKDGGWHHVAAVYNGSTSTLSLYVDYQSEGYVDYTNNTALTSAIGTGSDFRIGTAHSGANPLFGDIDYIRVSNVALTPAQFIGPVPEPSAIILLTTALVGLLAYAWRKRS